MKLFRLLLQSLGLSLSLASAVFRGNFKFYHLLFFFRLSKINQRMLKGSEHLSQIPSKTFFVCLYSIHECLFMGKFMLYIWYLSNNRHFIKWDFQNGRGNLKMFFHLENIFKMILRIRIQLNVSRCVCLFVDGWMLISWWNYGNSPFLPPTSYNNNQDKRFFDLFFFLVGWMSDGMTVMNGGEDTEAGLPRISRKGRDLW